MPMILWLYNLFACLALIFTCPLWLFYLAVSTKARAGFLEKTGRYSVEWLESLSKLPTDKPRIWFHAVSVGELNAIRPLIHDLSGDFTLLISTTTQTSQNLARRLFPELTVFYFPFDFRRNIHRLYRLLKPDVFVLTETELWPNTIDVLSRVYHVPCLLINGRISKRSFKGYMALKPLMEVMLHQVHHCYMQSQGDANRIRALGDLSVEEITVVGNLKFDIQSVVDPIQKNILSHLFSFKPQDTVLTFASTHHGEDAPLLEVYNTLSKDFPELKLILAPRHPERREEIKNILNTKGLRYSIRSHLSEAQPNAESIIIMDSIGELLTAYALSAIAVLGGSFVDKGGQNPLEPISQEIPVLFGPDMSNFNDISQMIVESGAGYQVQDMEDLAHRITELLTQPELCDTLVENGQQLLMNNRGTKEILSHAIRGLVAKP